MKRFLSDYWPWFVRLWGVTCVALLALSVFADSRYVFAIFALFVLMVLAQRQARCPGCGARLRLDLKPRTRIDTEAGTVPPRCAYCGQPRAG